MRTTALTLVITLATACVGEVGGGAADRGRGKIPKDGGSDQTGCTTPEKVEQPVTIRTAGDFDKLPKGCWDLWAKLRLEGPEITSLDKLGDLIAVNSIEIVGTNLTSTLDTKHPIEVYGPIAISGNPRLKDLDHLVAEQWGDVEASAVTIRNNAELAGLGGLRYLHDVTTALQISDNPKLATIALDELVAAGSLQVSNNAALTKLDVSQLTTVGGIEIASNAMLATIDGPSATDVGDLALRRNPALTSLGTWSALASVKGALTIDGNAALVDLGSLASLHYVTSAIAITNNAALTTITPVSHLQGAGGSVVVTGNAALSSCRALEVDHCVQSGTVTFDNNKPSTGTNCPTCWCGL